MKNNENKKIIYDIVSIIFRMLLIVVLIFIILNFRVNLFVIFACILDISIIYNIIDNNGSILFIIKNIIRRIKDNNKEIIINSKENINTYEISDYINICIYKCYLLDVNNRLEYYKILKNIINDYNENKDLELIKNRLISFEYKINCIINNSKDYKVSESQKILSLKNNDK